MNEHIARFLNDEENYQSLSERRINFGKSFNEDLDQEFSREILLSRDIDDEAYQYLVKSVYWWFSDLNVSEIAENRIDILIQEKKIKFSVANLQYLVESGSNKYVDLIETDIDKFLEKKPEIGFLPSGYVSKLISSTNLNNDAKGKIIRNIDSEGTFSDVFDVEKDFAFHLSEYVIANRATISFDFLNSLLDNLQDSDRKVRVIIQAMYDLDKNQIFSLFKKVGSPYSQITSTGQSISMPKSELNISLATALKDVGYITNFNVKKIKVQLYRKHN